MLFKQGLVIAQITAVTAALVLCCSCGAKDPAVEKMLNNNSGNLDSTTATNGNGDFSELKNARSAVLKQASDTMADLSPEDAQKAAAKINKVNALASKYTGGIDFSVAHSSADMEYEKQSAQQLLGTTSTGTINQGLQQLSNESGLSDMEAENGSSNATVEVVVDK
jgi:hypothetical protein